MINHEDMIKIMSENIDRLPESDKIVLLKLLELGNTSYGRIIGNILPDITIKWGGFQKGNYLKVKHKSIKKAVRKLWVDMAGKLQTFKIFDDFETFEKILFRSNITGSNYEYRGHYAHQFDVFLLGYYILNKLLTDNTVVAEILNEKSTNPNFTWLLAGTFHDMGYPIERIDYWFSDILNAFLKIETQYQVEVEKIFPPVFSKYIEILSQWAFDPGTLTSLSNTQLLRDWSFQSNLETSLRQKDHGVISSLLLIHSFLTKEEVTQTNDWKLHTFPEEVLPACHAIAVHNLESEDFTISFRKYPYAFLLILCDTIQDWQRSVYSEDYSELKSMDFKFLDNIPRIEFCLDINKKEKIEELNCLKKKLNTNGLIQVEIKQQSGNKIWIIE